MASYLYILRFYINNKERLRYQIEGPNGIEELSQFGDFGYTNELIQQIAEFQIKAREKYPEDLRSSDIRHLGEHLFEAIFEKSLQEKFEDLYRKVLEEDNLLRIELHIDDKVPQIAAIPWEFMRSKELSLLLSASPHLILSRSFQPSSLTQHTKLKNNEKIRVLVVVSNPSEYRGEKLQIVHYQPTYDALLQLVAEPNSMIDVRFTKNARFKEMKDLLQEYKPHIFHFIGHGRLYQIDGEDKERSQLALISEDEVFSEAQWVDASYISRLFNEIYPAPNLVFLQACEGARLSDSRAFSSVASHIMKGSVPAVIGMQYIISNDTAVEFAQEFYRRLAQSAPIDVAVQSGRYAISSRDYRDETRDYATPVLFMSGQNSHIFEREKLKIYSRGNQEQIKHAKDLYYALANLNFHQHHIKVRAEFGLPKENNMGAFVISGPELSGHHWLRNLVLNEVIGWGKLEESHIHPLQIDIGSAIYTSRMEDLWDHFAFVLTGEYRSSLSKKDVAYLIFERWKTGHTIIVMDNACKLDPNYPRTIIEQFWQPLTQFFQSFPKTEKKNKFAHWLLLFIIDTQGLLVDWNDEHIDTKDSFYPIFLPFLDSHFSQDELDQWWREPNTQRALSPVLSTGRFDSSDQFRQTVWSNSGNGRVVPLLDHICRACGLDWKKLQGLLLCTI